MFKLGSAGYGIPKDQKSAGKNFAIVLIPNSQFNDVICTLQKLLGKSIAELRP